MPVFLVVFLIAPINADIYGAIGGAVGSAAMLVKSFHEKAGECQVGFSSSSL
jgi:hypothetical protein